MMRLVRYKPAVLVNEQICDLEHQREDPPAFTQTPYLTTSQVTTRSLDLSWVRSGQGKKPESCIWTLCTQVTVVGSKRP